MAVPTLLSPIFFLDLVQRLFPFLPFAAIVLPDGRSFTYRVQTSSGQMCRDGPCRPLISAVARLLVQPPNGRWE